VEEGVGGVSGGSMCGISIIGELGPVQAYRAGGGSQRLSERSSALLGDRSSDGRTKSQRWFVPC
jgi:hypothetical protein